MLFTHMADPDRDNYMDGDDYTYEQPELPGVAVPAADLRRENAELRAALLTALVQLRSIASSNTLVASKIAELLGGS